MINRRHIRVKVMQSVYAILQSGSDNLNKEEKFLYASIDKMYDLYVLLLRLLVEVRDLESKHIEISKKKFLATPEELKPNTKFIDNQVFKLLAESRSMNDYLEEHSLNYWMLDFEYVNEISKLIKESDLYDVYMATKERSFKEDLIFIDEIFKTIVAPNEKLADYFEDKNITWVDDIPFVNTWIVKSLGQLKEEKPFKLGKLYKDEDDKNFVLELFRRVILNQTSLEKEVSDKTPNWDADRIADVDMILIKMAICEFLRFPSIPTRVTINEYIEISKDYSTTKSSFFINGVLDKILKDFTDTKRLNKIGRGLL
ncbi:MAG: transcription antitermination factor NusB [Lutibacter sp.]|nr:transcription antitermination factor NusB [Lutibacter sp.]